MVLSTEHFSSMGKPYCQEPELTTSKRGKMNEVKQAQIMMTGTTIKQQNYLCSVCTMTWGILLIFPLFFTCFHWWKKIAYPIQDINLQAYASLDKLLRCPNLTHLRLQVVDNLFDDSKAQTLYDAISRSSLKSFHFLPSTTMPHQTNSLGSNNEWLHLSNLIWGQKQGGDSKWLPDPISIHRQKIQMQKAQTKPAYLYQAYCNISMVVAQLLLKQLSAYFYIPLLLGLRASVLFLFNYIRLSWDGHSMMVSDSVLKAIIQRSLVSSTVVMTYLIPIMYIPICVANTLFNVSPIIMFFVEVYLFKKGRIHVRQLLLTVFCFVGVVCIIQPEFLFSHSSIPAEQLPFYFMALCAAFFSAFSLILLHNLRDKCDKQVALQYNYIFQAVVAYSIFLLNPSANHHPPSLHSWAQLGKILLLLLLLFHIFRIMAIYLIVPSKVAFLGYLTVVLSMLVDVLVFDSAINMVMGIGILLTSVGLIANTFIPKQ